MKLTFNLDNIRLRNKMMIIYVFCVLLPIVLTNVVFYQVTTNNVKNQRMRDIMRAIKSKFLCKIFPGSVNIFV